MTEARYNRILPESEGNVLCLEIGERVTLENYRSIFEPAMKDILARHADAGAVISYTRPFLGWDIDAAEHDIQTMTAMGRNVKKVALVHPPESVINRWHILKPLLGGEVKIFEEGQFADALAWVRKDL